jgi:hypothetical protein
MLLIWTSKMLLKIVEREGRGKNFCCVKAFVRDRSPGYRKEATREEKEV